MYHFQVFRLRLNPRRLKSLILVKGCLVSKKTVFITGANSGLGLATAIEIAKLGHIVYAGYRESKSNLNGLQQTNIIPIQANVRDDVSLRVAISAILCDRGRLDVCICNAGVLIEGLVENMLVDDFKTVLDVNCLGVLRTLQAVLPIMRTARSGRIIVLSSLSALIGLPNTSAYTASKFALEGLCESLQVEISPFGIDLCLAQPGAFKTNLGSRPTSNASVDTPDYSALRSFFENQKVKYSQAPGPSLAAKEITALIDLEKVPFRLPIGEQARHIVERLKGINENDRCFFSAEASDMLWWLQGQNSEN